MKYEYQVLESDSPGIPAEMLNEQGAEGWKLCSITVREAVSQETEAGFGTPQHWLFYFVREVNE